LLVGCTQGDFDFGKVQSMVEGSLVSLDGEQVMLTDGQVQCGAQSDLWDITQIGSNHSVGKLNQAARDLHFGDDVIIGETGMHGPYVQIRGTLQMRLLDVGPIRDDGEKSKLVDLKIGIEIPHPCFQNPLPQLMGVRRGRFSQDALPTFRFRMESNWALDRVQH
jgi:hypothetical protein